MPGCLEERVLSSASRRLSSAGVSRGRSGTRDDESGRVAEDDETDWVAVDGGSGWVAVEGEPEWVDDEAGWVPDALEQADRTGRRRRSRK